MLQDLRFATRSLRKSPAFLLIAVSSLALGIGANTAIFSFVNSILLKHLPVPQPDRLVQIAEYDGSKELNSVFSYPFVEELNKRHGAFQGVFGRFPVRVNLTSRSGLAEPLRGELVTGAYFQTLQVKPALGRLLNQEDVLAGSGNPVCVISYALWRNRFAGDPAIVGRKLLLNAHPYTVVGVTERGFYGAQMQSRRDVQLPVSRMGDFMGGFFASGAGSLTWKSAGFTWMEPVARIAPGVSRKQAEAMLQPMAHQIRLQLAYPNERTKLSREGRTYRLLDGSQGANYDSEFAKPLTVLMGVVGLVLLIACANLANLLFARANAREKEFAIRLSLGASRSRLIRQLMVESLGIAALGGAAGLLLSFWIVHTLLAYLNSGRSAGSGLQVTPDAGVLGFCVVLSFATALLFGIGPAWQSVRPAGRVKRDSSLFRKSLVAFQIAISVVIVFAAGLLTRTLSRLQTVDLGFDPAHVVALSLDPTMNGYAPAQAERVFDDILVRLRAEPGIAAAGLATVTPVSGAMITLSVEVPGHVRKSSDAETDFNSISPGYFAALDQRLLRGRDFSERDIKNAPHVAIVNQYFVSQYMPGVNPMGRHFKVGGGDVQIVGVVANSRYQTLRDAPPPIVYMPTKQTQSSGYTLLVRTRSDSRTAISNIERTIHAIDSKLSVYDVHTMEAQIEQDISSEHVLSFLSTLFSGLAILLCGIGLYGVVAYSVTRRTREIGVRFAVGAQRSDVAGLFLRESGMLIGAGIVLGIPAALAATRVLKSLLYGLQPSDVPTLIVASLILLTAGLLATILPVRRAATIEPLEALRYE